MVTKAERERKNANAEFRRMMDETVTHLRVGQGRDHRTSITLIGEARFLHGLDGVCTCCPRRPAGELTAQQESARDARAAAHRAAELGPVVPAALPSVPVELPVAQVDEQLSPKARAIAEARATARDAHERLGRKQ